MSVILLPSLSRCIKCVIVYLYSLTWSHCWSSCITWKDRAWEGKGYCFCDPAQLPAGEPFQNLVNLTPPLRAVLLFIYTSLVQLSSDEVPCACAEMSWSHEAGLFQVVLISNPLRENRKRLTELRTMWVNTTSKARKKEKKKERKGGKIPSGGKRSLPASLKPRQFLSERELCRFADRKKAI